MSTKDPALNDYPDEALNASFLFDSLLEDDSRKERIKDDSTYATMRDELDGANLWICDRISIHEDTAPEKAHSARRTTEKLSNPEDSFFDEFVGEENVIDLQALEISESATMDFTPYHNDFPPVSIDAETIWAIVFYCETPYEQDILREKVPAEAGHMIRENYWGSMKAYHESGLGDGIGIISIGRSSPEYMEDYFH